MSERSAFVVVLLERAKYHEHQSYRYMKQRLEDDASYHRGACRALRQLALDLEIPKDVVDLAEHRQSSTSPHISLDNTRCRTY